MILRKYLSDGITNVLAVTFFIIAILSFGYAQYFDRLFIISLLLVLLFNLSNANIVGVALIFLLERSLEEFVFAVNTYLLAKPVIYLGALYLIRVLWYDMMIKRLVLPTVLVCLACEVYWYLISYEPPQIHFYISLLILNMVTRHLIFLRVPISKEFQSIPLVNQYIKIAAKQIPIDWHLYSLAKIYNIGITVLIGEYLIRHLTEFTPLIIYENYTYLTHSLTVMTLFLITRFVIQSHYTISA